MRDAPKDSPLIQVNSTKAAVVLQTVICAANSVALLTGHVVTRPWAREQNSPTRYRSTLRADGNAAAARQGHEGSTQQRG